MSFQKGDKRHDFQVRCPYNKNHMMPYSKLFYHISNPCADQLKFGQDYQTCPYNSLHILRKSVYQGHLEKCKIQNTKSASLLSEMQEAINQQFGKNKNKKQQEQPKQQQQMIQNDIPEWGASEISDEDQAEIINEISLLNHAHSGSGNSSSHSFTSS